MRDNRTLRLLLAVLILHLWTGSATAARLGITLAVPDSLHARSVTKQAVADTLQLLSRSFPDATITLNHRQADITIILPELTLPATAGNSDRSYTWRSSRQGKQVVLQLTAATPEAISTGLYGLLQEKLGIRFIHPQQTIIPRHRHWPLTSNFSFTAAPRFKHQGFHLHTLHPMELTEQLHDPTRPGAFEEVAAYLDWLARNGQDSFQFFLLRGIDRTAWIPHIRRIVAYGQSRGIRCGVEISLAMLQQQAFQAITLLRPFPSYKRQVEETLAWLFQVPWDFISLESMLGEHLPLVSRLLPSAQLHLETLVTRQYQRPLLYATHVIRQEDGTQQVRRPLHPASGILIHTVMCYSASEPKAPVYGNQNQRFMLDAARQEVLQRPTWYWPESSYWVGFDSSVPLLLLPYLDTRWDDIKVMTGLGLQGHLTFSTGWEWGYWLVDWSIARWSWRYTENGIRRTDGPLSRLSDLFPDTVLQQQWQQALALQNRYLKDKELMRLMAAATPFAELPPPFNLPFQPDPVIPLRRLHKKAGTDELAAVRSGPVADLEHYAAAMEIVTVRLTKRVKQLHRYNRLTGSESALAEELITGLQVTALRARHRSLTLQALMAKHRDADGGMPACNRLLASAAQVRQQALQLVRHQETRYRYPIQMLARQRPSLTAYSFGYLYPAATLFFWEREEQQVRHGRFDPLFMNLWSIWRTLGLESLLLR